MRGAISTVSFALNLAAPCLVVMLAGAACSEFRPKGAADAAAADVVAVPDIPASMCKGKVCKDDLPCTSDECDPGTGECVHKPMAAGSPCDDGLYCTLADKCTIAGCAGAPRACESAEGGCRIGNCSEEEKGCVLELADDGALCDDGNECTSPDTCAAGSCTPGAPKTCPESGDPCTTNACDPATGECGEKDLAPGALCDDGDACTVGDMCDGGLCAGSPKSCAKLDDGACIVGVCSEEAGGQCVAELAPAGTECDDGLTCTDADTCQGGVCAGIAKPCSEMKAKCKQGVCVEPGGTCALEPLTDGTSCDDGDPCSAPDSCDAGICKAGPSKDCSALDSPCLAGVCDGASGKCTTVVADEGGICDDADPCTAGDVCVLGKCAGAPKDCSGKSGTCKVGVCNPSTGTCTAAADPAADGSSCDDKLYCTVDDVCGGGTCKGKPRECAGVAGECQKGKCDDVLDTCISVGVPNGTPCSDGLVCTTADSCKGGVCAGGPPLDCSKLDAPCMSGHCSESTGGCGQLPKADETPCADGKICTVGDACKGGQCTGSPLDCSALSTTCAVGKCDEGAGGCAAAPVPDGASCSDGKDCTVGDQCIGGKCSPGAAVDCPCPGPNRYLSFAGGCAVVTGGPPVSAAGFTIELWLRTSSQKPARVLDQRLTAAPGENDWSISYEVPGGKGQLRFHYGNVTGADSVIGMASVALNDGKWHHVALTRDKSTLRWWVDGISSFGGVASNIQPLAASTDLSIGCGKFGGEAFEGDIDALRFSSYSRYSASFVPPGRHILDLGTTALYHLDDVAVPGTFADAGPGGFSGSVGGSAAAGQDGPPGFGYCCGDGVLQPGEACDAGEEGDDSCTPACEPPDGVPHKAVRFDGKAGCIQVPGETLLNSVANLTIEMWIRTPGGLAAPVLDRRLTTAPGETDWNIRIDEAGFLTFFVGNQSGGESAHAMEKPVSDGGWHHVALTISQLNVYRWFLDGKPGDTGSIGGAKPMGNAAPLYVGCGLGPSGWFLGDLDSVRISTTIRYSGPFAPAAALAPDNDTALLLGFDEPLGGGAAHDLSSGLHHGAISGVGVVQIDDAP